MRDFAMPHHGDDHAEGPDGPGPLPHPFPLSGRGTARGPGTGHGPRGEHGAGAEPLEGPGGRARPPGRHSTTGDAPEAGETRWGTGSAAGDPRATGEARTTGETGAGDEPGAAGEAGAASEPRTAHEPPALADPSRADSTPRADRPSRADHTPPADGTPRAPRPAPAPSPLSSLVLTLRTAGLDPDAEQLGDALWLAGRIGGAPAEGGTGERGAPVGDVPPVPPPPVGPVPPAPPEPPRKRPAQGVTRTGGTVGLYTGRTGSADGPGLRVGVPAAPAFGSTLDLQRALRPLQRFRTAGTRRRKVLDETATAELSARAGGLVLPVYRSVERHEATLHLVLDASPSMRVWERMFEELRQVFSQLGAFAGIRCHYLHEGADAAAPLALAAAPGEGPRYAPERLADPTGRSLTLVVSDCAGELWRTGQGHRMLHRLARSGPVSVLQPLPQRLWNRTRLPVVFGRLTRTGTGRLQVAERTTRPSSDALPVPVVPPVPAALASWARLMTGRGGAAVTGAIGWVRADQPAGAAPGHSAEVPALQRVSRFRAAASPLAGRLATHLAAAPLSLPVMQLVQRTMLPGSGPAELAEVLLGGLLKQSEEDPATGPWYTFAPGVREALLGPLGRDEAALILKHCSEYVTQHFGKGGPNFPALALAQLDGGPALPPLAGRDRQPGPRGEGYEGARDAAYEGPGGAGDEEESAARGSGGVPQPFAEVAAEVLRRFLPVSPLPAGDGGLPHPALGAADGLVAEYERHGMVQSLMDAAQLLRSAVRQQQQPAPELLATCAATLLRLWRVERGEAMLQEARGHAEAAVAASRAPAHRAVLAQVLAALAEDARRQGSRADALDLLRAAEREYAAACAAPGLDPAHALRLTLERVGVLESQFRLSGDSSLLQSGVGMLEALADARTGEQDGVPALLALAHGRLLLRLAGLAGAGADGRVRARRAAHSLRTALDVTPPADDESALRPEDRPAVVLDLVDALLASGPEGLAEAARRLATALPGARARHRSELLARTARLHRARYAEHADPAELDAAAEHFGQALPGIPRDSAAHARLLAEWGQTLLERARLGDGDPAARLARANRAVQVLRSCLTETGSQHSAAPHRELLLGRALVHRHHLTGDRVDLREAEFHLGLAARRLREPLTAATAHLEWGQCLLLAATGASRLARYGEAADVFRAAARAGRRAQEEATSDLDRATAVSRTAQAHHWLGRDYAGAAQPRAARTAYLAALEEWKRLPTGMEAMGEPTPRQTAQELEDLAHRPAN
ncbi:SAV_2336 N-terminal domain-related protein [Streptomyces sp. NRRL F-5630]|uniref:SAV_2336 N-terminal domain-related protein n=1 Tax=Streptomyces sp. NRRL F-5630 TaxID=1463864 RepID=UPI003D704C08